MTGLTLRDHFAAAMAAVLEQENVRQPSAGRAWYYPASDLVEAWIPVGAERPARHERCEFELIIEAKPFNRHRLVCGARLTRGKRTIAVAERARFTAGDVQEWTRFAVGSGPRPSNYRPVFDAICGPLSLIVPPLSRRHNPIDRQFRPRHADIRTLLVAAACALLVVALVFREILTPVALALGVLVVLFAVLVPVLARRYRYHDWVVPQPREAPRRLAGHVDSWHAVLFGLGGEAERFKQRLVGKIEETPADLLDICSETYGYRTPNGYEEREWLVVSHQQGHVHIHIHPLGDDLFVGWQALLNWAQWTESWPFTIVDAGRRSIAFRDVKPTWYFPSEFDLIDLNSLSAVVQSAVEHEVRGLFTERPIDQEIDFPEVVRGNRDNALDARKAWPERSNKRQRNSNLVPWPGGVRRSSAGDACLAPIDESGGRAGLDRRNPGGDPPADHRGAGLCRALRQRRRLAALAFPTAGRTGPSVCFLAVVSFAICGGIGDRPLAPRARQPR